MALKDNLKKLSKDIQEIAYLVEKLQNNSRLTEIETDLLKHKLQLVYASVLKIETPGQEESSVKETAPQEQVTPPPAEKETIISEREETHMEETRVQVERHLIHEPESGHEDPLVGSGHQAPEKPATNKNTVLGDLFKDTQTFRNESLRNTDEIKDLSSSIQEQPIPDIATAIGINERFMFIRELFNNDQGLYAKTIEELNSIGSEEEARAMMSENFNWNLDQGAAKDLLDLARRKIKNNG